MAGNNRYGQAGRKGVPATTVVAFLDHYTHHRTGSRRNYINGVPIDKTMQRSIRRYRNGQVQHVSEKGLAHVLDTFGFDRTWFEGWAKMNRLPVA